MKKTKVFGTALAILLAGGGLLWAQAQSSRDSEPGDSSAGRKDNVQRASHEQQPPGIPDLKRATEVGASDQQIEKLRKYGFEQQVKRIELQAAADNASVALELLLSGPTPDENTVWTAVAAVNQARDELFKLDIATRLKVKQILGDEIMRKL